ncbi:MAG: hypothetical protein CMJ78_24540 [Planctomycetaceae bacterium]|nr:hypothetical protein [Planctomycetaceae bacterium]
MIVAVWHVFLQLAPWLLLGTLISGMLHVWLPPGFVHRKLNGRWGVFKAVAIGVPLPLCSCGVVPAGIGLKKDGASNGASVGFLISTPQTGVDSILVAASFLGWPFALFKVVSAAVTGIIGGFLADRCPNVESHEADHHHHHHSHGSRFTRMLDHGIEIIRSIWGWLLIGILVSAAIETFVPESTLGTIGGSGTFIASLTVLAISLPLYVCATASVPIAAALVAGGFPPGVALVFLMAGPATNVATIGAVYRRFGSRVLGVYLGTIIVGSIAFAMLFDWLLTANAVSGSHHHSTDFTWWNGPTAVALIVMLVWFAFDDARRWIRRRRAVASDSEMHLEVAGMTCNGCVNRLEKTLKGTDGITAAVVHLEPGEAIVEGTLDRIAVCEIIQEAGFQVKA